MNYNRMSIAQLSVMLPAQWFMDFKMNVTWERLADFSYEMTDSEIV